MIICKNRDGSTSIMTNTVTLTTPASVITLERIMGKSLHLNSATVHVGIANIDYIKIVGLCELMIDEVKRPDRLQIDTSKADPFSRIVVCGTRINLAKERKDQYQVKNKPKALPVFSNRDGISTRDLIDDDRLGMTSSTL